MNFLASPSLFYRPYEWWNRWGGSWSRFNLDQKRRFKEVIYDGDGKPKGNCDADLVLQAARDAYENKFDSALLIASDGDYAGLVAFLQKNQKFFAVLSPHPKDKCSILLKRTGVKIAYINDQRSLLERAQKEKAPSEDGIPQGSFS